MRSGVNTNRLPAIIGLCPVHAEHFYVPHDGVCPEPGCDQELIEYIRTEEGSHMTWLENRLGDALASHGGDF